MLYFEKSGEKFGSGIGLSVPSASGAPASGSQDSSRLWFEMNRVRATSTVNKPLLSRYCFIITVDFGHTAWLFCPSTIRALSFSAAAAGSERINVAAKREAMNFIALSYEAEKENLSIREKVAIPTARQWFEFSGLCRLGLLRESQLFGRGVEDVMSFESVSRIGNLTKAVMLTAVQGLRLSAVPHLLGSKTTGFKFPHIVLGPVSNRVIPPPTSTSCGLKAARGMLPSRASSLRCHSTPANRYFASTLSPVLGFSVNFCPLGSL